MDLNRSERIAWKRKEILADELRRQFKDDASFEAFYEELRQRTLVEIHEAALDRLRVP